LDIKHGLRMNKSFFTSTTYGHTKKKLIHTQIVFYDEKSLMRMYFIKTAAPLASKLINGGFVMSELSEQPQLCMVFDWFWLYYYAGVQSLFFCCCVFSTGPFLPITLFSLTRFNKTFFEGLCLAFHILQVCILARFIIRNLLGQQPEWVPPFQKTFAWSIALFLTQATVTLLFWSG